MSSSTEFDPTDDLTTEKLERVISLCDQFEREWEENRAPRIERYLELASGRVRARLFRELVALEVELRQQRNDATLNAAQLRAEYQARFPDQKPLLDGMWQASEPPTRSHAASRFAKSTIGPSEEIAPPKWDDYEILSELGRGGMGMVYKARQRSLKRLVALKMILLGPHADTAQRDRFRREAEAAARLQHPNMTAIHQVGEVDGLPYLVLEYVDGGTLKDRLGDGPLPAREAAGLLLPLARAIHAGHERGVIHRDLKPTNVLLTTKGTPKISDFGLAKILDEELGDATRTGELFGSPSYMAPEQAAGRHRDVGPPADIYALGAILYEMLTGRPPFQGSNISETLEQVRFREPVKPGRLRPKLPRDLETICLKCLEKDLSNRYHSAEALAADLERFLDGRPVSARPIGPIRRTTRRIRRRPVLSALAAGLVLALLAGLTLSSYLRERWREESEKARLYASRADDQTERSIAGLERLLEPTANMDYNVDPNSIAVARQHAFNLLDDADLSETNRWRLAWIMNWIAVYETRTATPDSDATDLGVPDVLNNIHRAIALWESIPVTTAKEAQEHTIGLLYANLIRAFLEAKAGGLDNEGFEERIETLFQKVRADLPQIESTKEIYLVWLLHMIGTMSANEDAKLWAERAQAICVQRHQQGAIPPVMLAIHANNESYLARVYRYSGSLSKAAATIDRGLALWREVLDEKQDEFDDLMGYAEACNEKHLISKNLAQGDIRHPAYEQGMAALRDAIGRLEAYRDSQDIQYSWRLHILDHLVILYNNLGLDLLQDPLRWGDAIDPFLNLRAITARLPIMRPLDLEEQTQHAYACYYAATLPSVVDGRPVDLSLLEEACAAIELALDLPGGSTDPETIVYAIVMTLELAEALERRGHLEDAEQVRAQCQVYCGQLGGPRLFALASMYLQELPKHLEAGRHLPPVRVEANQRALIDQVFFILNEADQRGGLNRNKLKDEESLYWSLHDDPRYDALLTPRADQ